MADEGQKFSKARLYVKATMLGFKRGLRNQYNHTSLVKIEGVNETSAVEFYLGKRIAYIYKVCSDTSGGGDIVCKNRSTQSSPL